MGGSQNAQWYGDDNSNKCCDSNKFCRVGQSFHDYILNGSPVQCRGAKVTMEHTVEVSEILLNKRPIQAELFSMAATCSSVAVSGSIILAGLPGASRTRKNAMSDTQIITIMVCIRRFIMYRIIFPSYKGWPLLFE